MVWLNATAGRPPAPGPGLQQRQVAVRPPQYRDALAGPPAVRHSSGAPGPARPGLARHPGLNRMDGSDSRQAKPASGPRCGGGRRAGGDGQARVSQPAGRAGES